MRFEARSVKAHMTQIISGLIVSLGLVTGCGSPTPAADLSAARRPALAGERAPGNAAPPPTVEEADQQAVNATGAATKQFLDRLQEYVDFHDRVEQTVPALKETANPEEIAAREKALGTALIKARPDAKEGDFLIASYRPILARLIRQDFSKRSAADRRALIVELPKGVTVGVNQVYPTTLPLATFPGNLLKVLPELPELLEYRIVGRDLILRDAKGNVVVDVMRNVFPISS
jgi:hypothetical protein